MRTTETRTNLFAPVVTLIPLLVALTTWPGPPPALSGNSPISQEATLSTLVGPPKGSLVIQGGGEITPEVWDRFVSLAGGPEANFVFIPTAEDPIDPRNPAQ